jgi:hypothetical protein
MVLEVLVHISTPATRQNDDLYRSLADAYLDFEPHIRHDRGARQDLECLPPSSTHVVPLEGSRERGAAETSILTTSKDSYGSFPSRLSSGGHEDVAAESADNDSIPTSSRLADLDRIHMRWKQQTTPKSSFVKGQRLSKSTSRPSDLIPTAFIEDTQLGAEALQSQLQDSFSTTDEDTSEDEHEPEIPLNQVPSDHNIQRSLRKSNLVELSTAKPTPAVPLRETSRIHVSQENVKSNAVEAQNPARAEPAAANPKVKLNTPNISRLNGTPRSSQLPAQAPNKKRKADEVSSQHVQDFSKLPLDAFPPAPKVSNERPGRLPSQITKQLAAIKAQNPKRFRTSKKHRTPKADERGYWSTGCSAWSVDLQYEFWTSLCEHISTGRLGWGTTLHRDPSSARSLGQVRVYCWAEVAEHVWLILWLCSKGQVAGSESRWIDADGSVVFEVS